MSSDENDEVGLSFCERKRGLPAKLETMQILLERLRRRLTIVELSKIWKLILEVNSEQIIRNKEYRKIIYMIISANKVLSELSDEEVGIENTCE